MEAMLKSILSVTIADFGYGWTLWVFLTWIPSFLSSSYGLELADFALFTSLILMAGVFGDMLGGFLSDFIISRTGRVMYARKFGIVLGLLGSLICLLPVMFVHDLTTVTIALGASFFFLELANAPLWSIPMDVASKWSGSASGLMNTGLGIAGIVSLIVFGAMVDSMGWQAPFFISVGLLIACAVLAMVMKPRIVNANNTLGAML